MALEPPRDNELMSSLSPEVEAANTLMQMGSRKHDQHTAVEIDSEEVDTSSQGSAIELDSDDSDASETELDSEYVDMTDTEVDSEDISEGSYEESEIDNEEYTSEQWQNLFFGYENANKSNGTDAEAVLLEEAHVMRMRYTPPMLCVI